MVRTVVGGVVGGFIIFFMSFLFWATPLASIAFSRASDAQSAAVQTALAQNLTPGGSGTYLIPDPQNRQGAELYARGPIATVSYNTAGFSPEDMSALLPGLTLAFVTGLLIAFGLASVSGGRRFGDLARLVVLFTLGITAWECFTNTIFGHWDWRFWTYSFVAAAVQYILAALVVARWFVPRHGADAAPAPAATEA